MSKEMTLIVLGVWVVVVPYLGIPGSWRTAILVLTGIGIAALGFLLRGEALGRGTTPGRHPTFVENTPSNESTAPAEMRSQPATPETHEHKEGITSLN